jgi:hypothetical protein
MGYKDYKLLLASAQTVTEEVSDFYVDTELTNPRWEAGYPLEVCITVTAAAAGGTGYEIWLLNNATTAPTLTSADEVCNVHVLLADLTKGKEIKMRIPDGHKLLRYVGLHFADISTGESMVVDAYIQPVM